MKRILPPIIYGLLAAAFVVALLGLFAPSDVANAAGEDGTRDVITPTVLSFEGITQTLAAATGDGHAFANTGETLVIIANAYTATITATFVTAREVDGLPVEDVDVTLGAGVTKIVGPFPTGVFNQTSGTYKNKVFLNWNTAITGTVANSVTLAAYHLR